MQYAVGRTQFDAQHPHSGHSLPAVYRRQPTAFSLTELLVVIAIIVLALALAVPALNLLTGAKSTEQANNLITGMLAMARNYAIGQQKYAGVMFYLDPASGRCKGVLVWTPNDDDAVLNLDLVDGVDALSLPSGILIQTIDDAGATGTPAVRKNDGYLGFNDVAFQIPKPTATTGLVIQYGGVILFDKHGQLASKVYSLQASRNGLYTNMGVLLYASPADAHLVRLGAILQAGKDKDVFPSNSNVISSQVGFVLLDEENFKNNGGTNGDAQIDSSLGTYAVSQPEFEEENWIDNNSVPYVMNHYNGAVVKGE